MRLDDRPLLPLDDFALLPLDLIEFVLVLVSGTLLGTGGTVVMKDISVLNVSILCSSTVLTLSVSDSSPNGLFPFLRIDWG